MAAALVSALESVLGCLLGDLGESFRAALPDFIFLDDFGSAAVLRLTGTIGAGSFFGGSAEFAFYCYLMIIFLSADVLVPLPSALSLIEEPRFNLFSGNICCGYTW